MSNLMVEWLDLAALAWGAAFGLLVAVTHLCLLDAIRRGR